MTPTSPAGQLRRMVGDHHLAELTEPDVETATQLLDDSEAHLRGVGAVIGAADFSGAQLLAYEVGRKAALALLMASGYRPAGGDEHRKTFEAARWLSSGRARQSLVEAGALRFARHTGMYRPQSTSEEDALEAQEVAAAIVADVVPLVRKLVAAQG